MYKYYRNYNAFKQDFYWHINTLNDFIRSLDTDTCWEFQCCTVLDPKAEQLDIVYYSLDRSKTLSVKGIKSDSAYKFEVISDCVK